MSSLKIFCFGFGQVAKNFIKKLESKNISYKFSATSRDESEIRKFENKKDTVKFKTWQGGPTEKKYLKPKYGFNRFNWDLRREPFEGFEKGWYSHCQYSKFYS